MNAGPAKPAMTAGLDRTLRAAIALSFAAPLVACGGCNAGTSPSPPELNAPFESGGRLRARVLDGREDALVFMEWFDRELGASCSFRRAADGVLRCLPSRVDDPYHVVQYLDASCTQTVVRLGAASSALPRYTIGAPLPSASCDEDGPRFPVHEVGPAVTAEPDLVLYWRDPGAGCLATGSLSTTDPVVLHWLGEEAPPERFVAATLAPPVGGARLGPLTLLGEDGSRQRWGIWDSERAERCTLLWDEPATCAPPLAWHIGQFSDESCTKPSAYASTSTPAGASDSIRCPESKLGVSDAYDCGHAAPPWGYGSSFSFFALGAEIDAVHGLTDGVCSLDPYFLGGDRINYELGPPLPEGSLGRAPFEWIGRGRLRVPGYLNGEGARLDHFLSSSSVFYDSALDANCYPNDACGGELLCAPSHASQGFSDVACTQPLWFVALGACQIPKFVSLGDLNSECWNGELGEVGSAVDPSTVYQMVDESTCAPYAGASSSGQELRLVTPSALAPARLVERVE